MSKLPGARVVGTVGFDDAGMRVSGACVRAPSDRFVTGIESVLYERATALAIRAESLTPTELGVTQSSADGATGLFSERLEGRTEDRTIAMQHMLTFIGPDRDALLCTAICTAPRTDATLDCKATVTSLRIDGPHSPSPAPGILTRTLFFAADHPKPSLVALALVSVLVIALILWRRPRSDSAKSKAEGRDAA